MVRNNELMTCRCAGLPVSQGSVVTKALHVSLSRSIMPEFRAPFQSLRLCYPSTHDSEQMNSITAVEALGSNAVAVQNKDQSMLLSYTISIQ